MNEELERLAKELHNLHCGCGVPLNNMVWHQYDGDFFIVIARFVKRRELESILNELKPIRLLGEVDEIITRCEQSLKELDQQ